MIFYSYVGDIKKEGGAINTMKNRSDIEVMASILRAAISNWEYKTTIMNNAVVSHSQLIRYLAIAVEKGLMEYSETTGLYKTTEAGVKYLSKYEQLLVLLPAIPDLPDLDSVTDTSTQDRLNEPIKDRLFS
jgi:predicted transcriptional regulator